MSNQETWETVIGLEVHVQLNTASKLFSGAATSFGQAPNSQACGVDLGLPGVLPVLNQEALKKALCFGIAINARIPEISTFDRKNYFYPDLPKGYQISQFEQPVVAEGALVIKTDDGASLRVRITRAHLEEDAGKSIHDAWRDSTALDFNRSGMPLLEVVTEPDLRSPRQAAMCFRHLHRLVRHLRICDGNLNEGSMRCDANISLRPSGQQTLGERTEIKNINSFRFLEQALEYEADRHRRLLESGQPVPRETRQFDALTGTTRHMRGKEFSDDYRYFPDPDLLPVRVTPDLLASVRREMPELPEAKAKRLMQEYTLGSADAERLTSDPDMADWFDEALVSGGDASPAKRASALAKLLLGQVRASLNRNNMEMQQCPVTPLQGAALVMRSLDGTLSSAGVRDLFRLLWERADPDIRVDALIRQEGLAQVSDTAALRSMIAAVLGEHPQQVEQYKAGKTRVLGFLVGQVMQRSGGSANPKQVTELLKDAMCADGGT